MANEMLRPGEVAARLGLSRSRVYQLLASRELPSVRIGGALRVPLRAWEAWLQRRSEVALASVKPESSSASNAGR